jgi:methylated-DNA-protein-cysteine methyltransferase related protein
MRRNSEKREPAPQRAANAAAEEPPFHRVWALVKRIPRGKVATYGQLSLLIDRRLTPVGVGWAIRAAPEGSIPWQRVVNARGGVSTDNEHPGLQRSMLEAEGVRFTKDGTIDMGRHGWRASPARGHR